MSAPFAGAVMMTFFAPAWMCLPAPGPSTKTPVPSMTMSIPSSAHGSLRGSLLETTLISLPSTLMVSLSTIFTSALKVPKIESYFSKCDAFLTPPLSLTTTTSRGESLRPCQHLRKFLPMRPNPLIATFNLATVTAFSGAALVACTFLVS
uniref:Uncharacterized protein n=1 Tax=Opuntia streptacantha TaxID=393608 RepID=A0A7C9DU98_OPUST